MIVNRTTKTFIAILTLVAAILLMSGHAVNEDPIQDWGLAGLLLLISIMFWAWLWQSDIAETTDLVVADVDEAPHVPRTQDWVISKDLIDSLEARVRSAGSDQQAAIYREKVVTEPLPTPDVDEPEVAEEAELEPVEEAETSGADQVAEELRASVDVGTDQVQQPDVAGEIADAAPAEAQVVQEAKEGEPVAEKMVSDASAAPDATTTPDDLTRIEGIGPKYRDALIEAGIRTFQDLAELSEEQLLEAVSKAGMRRSASMATWAEQARLAGEGDWEGLYTLQGQLRGGRSG
jgi:predicted flap endonuclease-1-like 5' DNA nuclease